MTTAAEQAKGARQFIRQMSVGVLSTISVDVEGYPFGSITPYTLNDLGEPIILISNLAQHTRNIKANEKVSLTVFDSRAEEVQATARLTWIGDAAQLDDSSGAARARYLRYFPAAESYFQMHDFSLYVIKLRRARFIGGFGQIHWVEVENMIAKNPLAEMEADIIAHMNEDHHDALNNYCRVFKKVETSEARMAGIDSEGFDVMAGKLKLRFEFEAPVTNGEEARAALVKLAREARSTNSQ